MFVKLLLLIVVFAHLGTAKNPDRIVAPVCTFNGDGTVKTTNMVPSNRLLYCIKKRQELYTVRGVSCCRSPPSSATLQALDNPLHALLGKKPKDLDAAIRALLPAIKAARIPVPV